MLGLAILHILKKMLERKLICSYESKKGKKGMFQYYFYSIFNLSSCTKPEIQNELPKITKIK